MKYFLLITSLLLSITAFAEDTNLLAKCRVDIIPRNINNTSDINIIQPKDLFFYIIKEEDKLFAIHDIAHKEDNMFVREQTLRADLPLYELKETSVAGLRFLSWEPNHAPSDFFSNPKYRIRSIPSIKRLKEHSKFSKSLNLSTKREEGFKLGHSGRWFGYAYEKDVQASCFIWRDWLEEL